MNYTNLVMYLQLSNYNSFEGVLYCKPHFDQLFKRTGSLDKSFEGNKGSKIQLFKASLFFSSGVTYLYFLLADQGHQKLLNQTKLAKR